MKNILYNKEKAVEYARKWAFARNPKYYNFDKIGGDCTNFVSQCIYAGANSMNYKKENGWYYINANNKSPSWTGVEFLYEFIITNKGVGPYGKQIEQTQLEIGDVAQLSFDGNKFEHTLIIVKIENRFSLSKIKIACHTIDSLDKAISEYSFNKIRFLHINGIKKY